MKSKDMDVLFGCRLFGGLPEETVLEWLESDCALTISAKRGEVMLSSEEIRRGLVVLLRGSAIVYKNCEGGRRVIMSRLGPGDIFGMTTLFYEAREVPTQVVASAACSLLVLKKPLVERMLRESPELARSYITLLSERIHFLGRRLGTFTGGDTTEKLLDALESFPRSGGAIEVPYSMTQLASVLGVGRASLYRAMDELAQEGILLREGRMITILEPERFGVSPGATDYNEE